MKKFVKFVNFLLPVIIYIACSLFAFLLWKIFNYAAAPIISTSIILVIIGSLLSGFFARGKAGKNGMFLAIAAAAIGTILWIIANTFRVYTVASVATVLSSYLFNIFSCVSVDAPKYTLYIGYAISLVAPILLILLGRLLRVKILKKKA